MTRPQSAQTYPLWGVNRTWQDFEVVGESNYLPAIRRAWNANPKSEYRDVRVDLELVPEPDNPHDDQAISVRYNGHVLGYFSRDTNGDWWPVVARVAASGLTAVAPGRVWYQKSGHHEIGNIRLGLGEPDMSLPLNDPPSKPHNLLPSGNTVQVTKEVDHFDVLADYVPPSGTGSLFLTLHKEEIVTSRSRRIIAEVRLDGERVGELTRATSEKYMPAIEHNADRGLATAVRGAIKGSGIAAEVTVRAAKAFELDDDVLDGPAVRLPALAPYDPDGQYSVPGAYRSSPTSTRSTATKGSKQRIVIGGSPTPKAAPANPKVPPIRLQSTVAQPPQPHQARPAVQPAPTPAPTPATPPAPPAPTPFTPPAPPAQQTPPQSLQRLPAPPAPTRTGTASTPAPALKSSNRGIQRTVAFAVGAFVGAVLLGILASGLGSPEAGAVLWLLGIPAAVGAGIWAHRTRHQPTSPGNAWTPDRRGSSGKDAGEASQEPNDWEGA